MDRGPEPPKVRTGLPFVGPAAAYQADPVGFLLACRKRYGDVFTLDLVLQNLTYVTGPEAQRAFLLASDDTLDFTEATNRFSQSVVGTIASWGRLEDVSFGNGMIRAGLMAHANLDGFLGPIEDEARATFASWADQGSIDLFPASSHFVTQTNIRALVGRRVRDDFGATIAKAYYAIEEQGMRPEALAFPWLPSKAVRTSHAMRAVVGDVFERVMGDPRYREPGTYFERWLDTPFPDGEPATVQELRAHFLALLFAAHVNTTGTFAWTLAHVLRRPELLEKLRAEQDGFRARNGDAFTFQSLRQLDLLDACSKEAVRMHFTLVLVRKTKKPFPVGGYVVPEGRILAIAPIVGHLDERVFERPNEFLPERFLDEGKRREWQKSGAYVQFGQGPHRCLGEMYANAVLKTAWSLLLRDYDLALESPDLPPPDWSKAIGTPFASAPIRVRVTRRR